MLLDFFVCNSVRIGQNFQNEVSMERCIFAEVAASPRNSFNWKLDGSKKENMHCSIENESDLSRPPG